MSSGPNPAGLTLAQDLRDATAILDLVIKGSGRSPQQRTDALVKRLVWAGVRRRRVLARTALSNQLLGTLELRGIELQPSPG